MNKGKNYVFVGGVPRSGTSIFQKILDGHPLIYGGPEFDHLPRTMKLFDKYLKGVEENHRQESFYTKEKVYENFNELITNFFQSTLEDKGKQILSEKTPSNILVFKDLIKVFPEAKFIWVIRDPRASLNSYQKVYSKNKKANIGKDILSDIREIMMFLKAGDKFSKEYPSNCLIIHYEDFILNPQENFQKVCDFIGVDFVQDMINTERENDTTKLVNKDSSTVDGYMTDDYHKPLNQDLINKWKKELPKNHIKIFNHYLAKLDMSHLKRYDKFKKLGDNKRKMLLIKEHGVKWGMKRVLK